MKINGRDVSDNTVVVTRHRGLVDYLLEENLITEKTPVFPFCRPEDIRGKNVIGILPLYLAATAETVTEFPVIVPQELHGQSLSLSKIRNYVRPPQTFRVTMVADETNNMGK